MSHASKASESGSADDGALAVPGATRRQVLRTSAVVGVGVAAAAGLAACGASSGDSGATPSAGASSTNAPTASPGTQAVTGAIVELAEIPPGGSVVRIVNERKVVVVRGGGDQVRAFGAVCTHAGCTVKGIDNGSILCVCHGSRFDPVTGSVLQGPARAPLAEVPVRVQSGTVVFA